MVSSDETRREKVDELLARNKKLSWDEAFQRSGKTAGGAFMKQIREFIQSSAKRDAERELLFLDKNHPPNTWERTI